MHYKINNNLYLHSLKVNKNKKVLAPSHVNHIAVIDCSGSMSYDLPKIREQLKTKLKLLLKEKDTISIIWFSGKNQFGTLLEGKTVDNLQELAEVNSIIDRWLRPVCLTGFKEPLQEASKLAKKLTKPNYVNSLFFMSDGYDNQWSRSDILQQLEATSKEFSSVTFVEYGYYADHNLLQQMAEKSGGSLVQSSGFDKYAPSFEAMFSKRIVNSPKVSLEVPNSINNFAFSLENDDIITFSIENNNVLVPESTSYLYCLSESKPSGKIQDLGSLDKDSEAWSAAYAALSLYSSRLNSDVVLSLLKVLGDVKYIEQFSGAFGKQKIMDFQDITKIAAFNTGFRLLNGRDTTKVPDDDAFTVLDLLDLLGEDSKLLVQHPSFTYKRIGRSYSNADEVLTKQEQEKIAELTSQLENCSDIKLARTITAEIDSIIKKPESLVFKENKNEEGYPLSALVYAEERPNISIRVKKEGTVNLASRLPENSSIPVEFPTYVYRNYTVIKDGILNISKLPCNVPNRVLENLHSNPKIPNIIESVKPININCSEVVFDLNPLPIINRKMVKSTTFESLAKLEWELVKSRAYQKVLKHIHKEIFGEKKSASFEELYGLENSNWLKEQGITDYSGFNPKMVADEASDYYLGKELAVNIKSFSSLPSINAVEKKASAGKKFTPSEAIIADKLSYVKAFMSSNNNDTENRMLQKWLTDETQYAIYNTRKLIREKANIVFAIVVGQTWFTDFESVNETEKDLLLDNETRKCSVEMKEVQINI